MKTNEANNIEEVISIYRNADNATKARILALLIHYVKPTKTNVAKLFSPFLDCEIQSAVESLQKIKNEKQEFIEAEKILLEELQRRRTKSEKIEIF